MFRFIVLFICFGVFLNHAFGQQTVEHSGSPLEITLKQLLVEKKYDEILEKIAPKLLAKEQLTPFQEEALLFSFYNTENCSRILQHEKMFGKTSTFTDLSRALIGWTAYYYEQESLARRYLDGLDMSQINDAQTQKFYNFAEAIGAGAKGKYSEAISFMLTAEKYEALTYAEEIFLAKLYIHNEDKQNALRRTLRAESKLQESDLCDFFRLIAEEIYLPIFQDKTFVETYLKRVKRTFKGNAYFLKGDFDKINKGDWEMLNVVIDASAYVCFANQVLGEDDLANQVTETFYSFPTAVLQFHLYILYLNFENQRPDADVIRAFDGIVSLYSHAGKKDYVRRLVREELEPYLESHNDLIVKLNQKWAEKTKTQLFKNEVKGAESQPKSTGNF